MLVNQNAVNPTNPVRAIPDLYHAIDEAFTDSGVIQYSAEPYISLREACQNAAVAAKLGFRIETDIRNKVHFFRVYKGADHTVGQTENMPCVFSPEFDNVLSQEFTHSIENFRTAAYVGGQVREGVPRTYAEVSGGNTMTVAIAVIQAGAAASSTAIILLLNVGASCAITSGGRREVRFTAPVAGTYTFESSNKGSLDPCSFTALTGGTTIDDDSAGNQNYRFTQTLAAGQTYTYYSGVYSGTASGTYTITVTSAASILEVSSTSWSPAAAASSQDVTVG